MQLTHRNNNAYMCAHKGVEKSSIQGHDGINESYIVCSHGKLVDFTANVHQ